MVGYFKEENYLFMAAGAVLGCAGAWYFGTSILQPLPLSGKAAFFVLPLLVGGAVGRVVSALWCGRRILSLSSILYDQCNPKEFMEKFEPIAARAHRNTIEYIDGHVRLAFAHEAMGEFHAGLELLDGLHPEDLRAQSLLGSAIVMTQRARLLLMSGNRSAAERAIDRIHALLPTARQVSPAATSTLEHSIDLYGSWLDVLNGNPSYKTLSWLREEADHASNRIHQAEMLLLLARGLYTLEQQDKALEALHEALEAGRGLWIGERAAEILEQENSVPRIPIYWPEGHTDPESRRVRSSRRRVRQ